MKTTSPSSRTRRLPTRKTPLLAPKADRSVFTEIRRDHETFRKALKRVRSTYARDPEKAKGLYSEFRVILHAHAKAEEETLYASLLAKSAPGEKLDDEVREGKEEHHVADFLLNELTQIPAADPKWKAKFKVLQESVEHHLDEEEDYFKLWRGKLSRAEEAVILDQFKSRRSAIVADVGGVRH